MSANVFAFITTSPYSKHPLCFTNTQSKPQRGSRTFIFWTGSAILTNLYRLYGAILVDDPSRTAAASPIGRLRGAGGTTTPVHRLKSSRLSPNGQSAGLLASR